MIHIQRESVRLCKSFVLLLSVVILGGGLLTGCSTPKSDVYAHAARLGADDFRKMLAVDFPEHCDYRDSQPEVKVFTLANILADLRRYGYATRPADAEDDEDIADIDWGLDSPADAEDTEDTEDVEDAEGYLLSARGLFVSDKWLLARYDARGFTDGKVFEEDGTVYAIYPELDGALRTLYTVCHLIREGRTDEASLFFTSKTPTVLAKRKRPPHCRCPSCGGHDRDAVCPYEPLMPWEVDDRVDPMGVYRYIFMRHVKSREGESDYGVFPVRLMGLHSQDAPAEFLAKKAAPPQRYVFFFAAFSHQWCLVKVDGRWLINNVRFLTDELYIAE
jgi:hypothetical protein